MANTRSLSTAAPLTAASGSVTAAAPVAVPSPGPSPRHRLRAVGRDEVVDITEFLPPGATWLPAPQHALPTLPGRPPMIGYLVLVPADRQGRVPTLPQVPSVPPVPQAEAGEDELVRVDTAQRTARVDGRPLDLTYLEFELLAHLVAHPGRVHTRDQLVTTVWGYGHVGDGRTVDVHIARLRRKLGAEYRQAIQTVRRVGYKYTPPLGR
ncbi:winged helix-turn-helix domain-containing protein [Streptomyces caniscabiei]|uniref:winged helix-turn-helix domain-containing protein n=1 Tax=Streptomyces caniscabiei TaxID=2746961 RepID=UPI0029A581FD|nr:winged helix-turn-helix domain-containing protein [Streptomyces caniscabiei]MDX3732393.1 winged helix-turn-helix domain-containing protein [Streptomyces caniscabiei]